MPPHYCMTPATQQKLYNDPKMFFFNLLMQRNRVAILYNTERDTNVVMWKFVGLEWV